MKRQKKKMNLFHSKNLIKRLNHYRLFKEICGSCRHRLFVNIIYSRIPQTKIMIKLFKMVEISFASLFWTAFVFSSGAIFGAIYMDTHKWAYRAQTTYSVLVTVAEILFLQAQDKLGLTNKSKPLHRKELKSPSSSGPANMFLKKTDNERPRFVQHPVQFDPNQITKTTTTASCRTTEFVDPKRAEFVPSTTD